MTARRRDSLLMAAIGAAGVVAPWAVPEVTTQLAFLWLMILFALTWDVNGGQMGYNSGKRLGHHRPHRLARHKRRVGRRV